MPRHAIMQLDYSNSGPFSLSVGAEFNPGFQLQIVADKRAITALPAEVIVLAKACAAEKKEKRTKVGSGACGETVVLAFEHSIRYARNSNRYWIYKCCKLCWTLSRMLGCRNTWIVCGALHC